MSSRQLDPEWKKGVLYGFGHLTGSYAFPDDAHSADSAVLAEGVFGELGLSDNEQNLIDLIAEHVAGNYQWTGEAEKTQQRIERGEI